jgi:hypothetical protein
MVSDSDNSTRRLAKAEVLPPLALDASAPMDVAHLPRGVLGVSLFARARYASEKKQVEAYHRLVSAKNALLRAFTEQQGLIQTYAAQAERAYNLDDIRETARLGVRRELMLARQQLAATETEVSLRGLRAELEKESLELELARLRKARAEFDAGPTNSGGKRTIADKFEDVGKEIEEIEASYEQLRTEMVTRAGGEDKLTAADRHRLGQFALLKEKLLNDAMEALL